MVDGPLHGTSHGPPGDFAAPRNRGGPLRLALFEDRHAARFFPLTLTRPVFELVVGHFSVRERWIRALRVTEWGAFLRSYLAEVFREQHPEATVNSTRWLERGPTLVVNGAWLPDPAGLELAANSSDAAGHLGDTPVFATVQPDEASLFADHDWDIALARVAARRRAVAASGVLLSRPWDLIEQNPAQIRADFALRKLGQQPLALPSQCVLQGPPDQVHVDRAAGVDPFVVIDARRGPVSIDPGAVILPFTRIEGPCHVGTGSQLFRAHVRGGTTIGPHCRIGGEIEASIIHGYANKYHDGFLGHSYVGMWVNLGAQTSNSDLKNDYSPVRVPLCGTAVDTGLSKVGCFIGDHTKTAINSLFNTGTSIGVMCFVMPIGELLPKHIPSFCSLRDGGLAPGLDVDRLLSAARVAMSRRDRELTAADERLLRFLFLLTRKEREDALARAQEKRWLRAEQALRAADAAFGP